MKKSIWSVVVDDPYGKATQENDIEPDSFWASLELAQEHARRVKARFAKAYVVVMECVIRDRPMTETEYKEHRDA